jgi:hypothetical protein
MSKINQIQKRLLELDGGAFQKLADAYLHKKGYERINPLGFDPHDERGVCSGRRVPESVEST